MESLEHSVLDNILDGRPMEGITCPELLECTLKFLDTTLDGVLVEKISDWEPAPHPVQDATLDGRPMEGTTIPEPLEHSVLVESLDSGLTEGMLSLETLMQSVLNTLLVARPMEGSTETKPPECSALASQLDYGQSNLESPARPLLDITHVETTDMDTDPSERSVLVTHLDHLSVSRPLEHSVLDIKMGNDKLDLHDGPLFGSDRRWSCLEITEGHVA